MPSVHDYVNENENAFISFLGDKHLSGYQWLYLISISLFHKRILKYLKSIGKGKKLIQALSLQI